MKKIFLAALVLSLVFSAAPLHAEEVAAVPAVGGMQESYFEGAGIAFQFEIPDGRLIEAQTGKIFTSGELAADFVLPSLKEAPTPIRYPRWAVREGWQGRFVIAVEITIKGQVGRWHVMESTGYTLLDQAATDAIRTWRFHPATEMGKAVISCIQIPVDFRLDV